MALSTFSAPIKGTTFYSGAGSSSEVPRSLPVAIGGRPFLIDVQQYARRTIPAIRDPRDQATEPGEQSLTNRGLWRRSQSSWVHGAGQEFLDDDDSLRTGFYKSVGINPWDRHELKLLRDTDQKRAGSPVKIMALDGSLYLMFGPAIEKSSAPINGSASFSTIHSAGGYTDITTDGTLVYWCNSTDAYKYDGTTVTTFSPDNIEMMEYANGRLFAAIGRELWEYSAAGGQLATNSGSSGSVHTHRDTSFRWDGVMETPVGPFAYGRIGNTTQVFHFEVNETNGTLRAGTVAASFPRGERVNKMMWYAGFVLIATSKGLRLGQINGTGIDYFTLVDEPGDVKDLDAFGRYIYFGWTNYNSSKTGIGRADLGRILDDQTPAFATDLMAATQGTVTGVAWVDGVPFFAVNGVGVYGPTANGNLVSEGTLESGFMNYGTAEEKVWISADLRYRPLKGEISVVLEDELGVDHAAVNATVQNSTQPRNAMTVGKFVSESVNLKVTLKRSSSDATLGPKLKRWVVKALPTPQRVDEIVVPVIAKSRVNNMAGDGAWTSMVPSEEFAYLKALESAGTITTYQEGSQSYSVYIDGVELRPNKWMDDRSFFEGTIMVTLITVGG